MKETRTLKVIGFAKPLSIGILRIVVDVERFLLVIKTHGTPSKYPTYLVPRTTGRLHGSYGAKIRYIPRSERLHYEPSVLFSEHPRHCLSRRCERTFAVRDERRPRRGAAAAAAAAGTW